MSRTERTPNLLLIGEWWIHPSRRGDQADSFEGNFIRTECAQSIKVLIRSIDS